MTSYSAPNARRSFLRNAGALAASVAAARTARAADEPWNLFLLGAGLFPTSGAVNPTFTVCALALRSADFIVRNWASLA